MSISFHNAIGLYENALSLRSDKAAVLSANLANADTPGFKARDLDFKAELRRRMGSSDDRVLMRSSHSGHIAPNVQAGFNEKLYRVPQQPSIDGNTVEEQVEHAEFMKNTLEFQAAFTILNSRFKGLTKALRGD